MEQTSHSAANGRERIVPAADVALIGGGHAHVDVIRRYGMLETRPFRLTLITDETMAPYSGMLPGMIAGHYQRHEGHIDLGHLCLSAGVRFIAAPADGISLDAKTINIAGGRPPIPYESLSVDIGSRPLISDSIIFRGTSRPERSIGIKPVAPFLRRLDGLDQEVARASVEKPLRIVLIGGGVAGCEVALSLAHRWSREARTLSRFRIKIIESGREVLTNLPQTARKAIVQAMRRAQIQIQVAAEPVAVDFDRMELTTSKDAKQGFDQLLWTTNATSHNWLKQTGLTLDQRGFILVGPTLESVSHEGIYAAGDTASMAGAAHRPKAGVFAVRQGPILFENLCRRFRGLPQRHYHPQKKFLVLISLGGKSVTAVRGGLSWNGIWLWLLKDRIDRKFMQKFQVAPLPVKVATYIESGNMTEMPCTACGSKLPADALNVLPGATTKNDQIILGVDSREDCSVIALGQGGYQAELVQSLDYIRAFASDLHLVGRVAAAHCINDIFAMGRSPHSAHVLATVAFGPKTTMSRDLSQLMAGIHSALVADQISLLGGHSQAGFHAGAGLMIQGLLENSSEAAKVAPLWSKRNLKVGDHIVLTKPIGSGVLLAGYMRYHVSTEHLQSALSTMAISHGPAVTIAHKHGIHAATDVTGFGLAFHLAEMCRVSGVSARIDLPAVPTYKGAFRALEAGLRASLHAQNRQPFAPILRGLADRSLLLAECLFDPQTAGGLLLGVPSDQSKFLCHELHVAGFDKATVIGDVITSSKDSPALLSFAKVDAR